MASTFQADEAKSGAPAPHTPGYGAFCIPATYELTAALVINDVLEMLKLPEGAVVSDVILISDDLDTNGTPLIKLDVGTPSNPDYFIKDSTVAQTGGVARADQATAHPLTLTAETKLQVKCSTAPATGVVGTVSLVVIGSFPNN